MTRTRLFALAAAAGLAAALLAAPRPAAVPAGLLLALVLPGLAATSALVPGRTVSLVERIVLVPALSLALVVLGGLALDASHVPLGRWSWGALTAGGTVLAAVVGRLRYRRPESTGRPRLPWRRLVHRLVPLTLAGALIGAAAWVSVASAHAQSSGTPVVALSMTAVSQRAGGVRTVLVAVHGTGPYALRLTGANNYQAALSVTVDRSGTWSRTLEVSASGRVTALLYRPGDGTPYRVVYLDGVSPLAGT